jgi:acetyl esterase/lipase
MQSLRSLYFYYQVKKQMAQMKTLSIEERRIAYDQLALRRGNFAKEVSIERKKFGIYSGDFVQPNGSSKGIIIYLHGGVYALGSALSHRAIGTHLAKSSGAKVFLFDYPLAPERPFPAALYDTVGLYRHLLAEYPDSPIALVGDSAGAGLAIGTSLVLRDAKDIMPVCLGLLSPWTDLTHSNATHQSKKHLDPFFPDPQRLINAAKNYVGEHSLKDPLISAQFAKLNWLPPMLIQVGDYEALLDDAIVLHQNAQKAGVQVQLQIWPKMWHVWQLLVGKMPEATKAVQDLGKFLHQHFQ